MEKTGRKRLYVEYGGKLSQNGLESLKADFDLLIDELTGIHMEFETHVTNTSSKLEKFGGFSVSAINAVNKAEVNFMYDPAWIPTSMITSLTRITRDTNQTLHRNILDFILQCERKVIMDGVFVPPGMMVAYVHLDNGDVYLMPEIVPDRYGKKGNVEQMVSTGEWSNKSYLDYIESKMTYIQKKREEYA